MTVRGRARLSVAFPVGLLALFCLLALRHSIQARRPPAAVVDASHSELAVAGASHTAEPPASSTPRADQAYSRGQALERPIDVLQRIAEGILSGTGGWRDIAFDKPGELDLLFDDPGFLAFLRQIHGALGPEGPNVLTEAYGLSKSRTYRFLILSLLSEYDDPRAAEFISNALQAAGSPREVTLAMLCLCRLGNDASVRVAQVYLQTVLEEGRGDLVAYIGPAIGRLGVRAVELLLRASESSLSSGVASEQIILGATKGPLSYVRPGNDFAALNRIAREDPRSPIRAMAASAIARGEPGGAVPVLLDLYSNEPDGEVRLWMLSSLMDVLGSMPGPVPMRSVLTSAIAQLLRTTDNPRLFRVAARGAAFLGDPSSSDMVKNAFHSDLSARFPRDEAERLRGDLLVDLTWADRSRAEALVREWFDEQGLTPVTLRAASASLQNPSDEELRRRLHQYLASE